VLVDATLYRKERCFPPFMIAPSAHYVSFVFLYGMRMFGQPTTLQSYGTSEPTRHRGREGSWESS